MWLPLNNGSMPTKYCLFFLLLILTPKNVLCSSSSEITKCCDPGQMLTAEDGDFFCSLLSNNTLELHELHTRSHEIPKCQSPAQLNNISLSEFSGKISGPACLDILSETPVVLYCSDAENKLANLDPVSSLLKIKRCCQPGKVYKADSKSCVAVEQDVSTVELVKNMTHVDFVSVARGPPKCEHAITDYEYDVERISLSPGEDQVISLITEDGKLSPLETGDFCLDAGASPDFILIRMCSDSEFCEHNSCLRKCCPEDEATFMRECRKLPAHMPLGEWHRAAIDRATIMQNVSDPMFNTTDYGLLLGDPCLYRRYYLEPNEGWHITPRGHVILPGYAGRKQHHDYCLDMLYNRTNHSLGIHPFVCFDKPTGVHPFWYKLKAAFAMVSIFFSIITLLVYMFLPELQNLHGKTLMCEVGSQLLAFTCLSLAAFAVPGEGESNNELCEFLGYTMLFAFLSTFSWLNVMCFDIWWTFGGLRGAGSNSIQRHNRHGKRFRNYCIYAWGVALSITIFGVATDHFEFFSVAYRPMMGFNSCWFGDDINYHGAMVFFIAPVTVQLLVNTIFFILTARCCSKVKAEIKRVMESPSNPRSRRFETHRTTFIMNLKLFVVMGLSWIPEIISHLVNHYAHEFTYKVELFLLIDIINCLRGVLIFILFVLKKKVYHAIRGRLGAVRERRANATGIHDPFRVKKSASSSTLMSTFAVSTT